MKRFVPPAMLAKLQSGCTTLAQLLLIVPKSGNKIGWTNTNAPITYDDGTGVVTYDCLGGFEESAFEASSGREVDNGEARIVFPDSVPGLTVEQVRAGYLDDARFRVLLVDYDALTDGHAVIDWGFVGALRIKDGMAAVIELRGAQQIARQKAVVEVGSKTCRATFGDASTGCHFDLSGVGGSSSVTAPGAEPDLQFSTAAPIPVPGLVTFTSGANSGLAIEVDEVDTSGNVTLMFPLPYALEAGDTFDWRPDCDKTLATCKAYGQLANFRGEPHRPEAIGDKLQFPGASTS